MASSNDPELAAFLRMPDGHIGQVLDTGTTDGVLMNGLPTVLLTYTGAKSGKERRTPLMRVEHQGRSVAVASNGAQPDNPLWYASLVAEPVVKLQDGRVTREYRAREVFGAEKAIWWGRAVDAYPDYAAYQRRIERQIPVLVLEPITAP
jgi:deazaflavin-dependent oxidoreductase (nitroreductase family)